MSTMTHTTTARRITRAEWTKLGTLPLHLAHRPAARSYTEKGADHLGNEGMIVGLGQAGYGDCADNAHVLDANRKAAAVRREQPWLDAPRLV